MKIMLPWLKHCSCHRISITNKECCITWRILISANWGTMRGLSFLGRVKTISVACNREIRWLWSTGLCVINIYSFLWLYIIDLKNSNRRELYTFILKNTLHPSNNIQDLILIRNYISILAHWFAFAVGCLLSSW